jgi:hypothetical protein
VPPSGARQPMANIKLDLTITDTYSDTPTKKTATLIIQAGNSGNIRTANVLGDFPVRLNIDAQARLVEPGLIYAGVNFEYTPAPDAVVPASRTRPAELREAVNVLLQDGKPLLVSQSADPATNRRVTVELVATLLR